VHEVRGLEERLETGRNLRSEVIYHHLKSCVGLRWLAKVRVRRFV
jgi:hypothetical protein